MIAQIRGRLIAKNIPQVVIEAHGIGYEMDTSMTTFFRLPEIGNEVSLLTHLIVREDAHMLYGFYDETERALFRALIRVNGVGPKLAITILSSIQPEKFVLCVQNNDSSSLTTIPGIGKKTAERLVIEMRDKLRNWQAPLMDPAHQSSSAVDAAGATTASSNAYHIAEREALSALLALGYRPQEASRALAKISNKDHTSEQLIRLALQGMTST